ncbi:MAG: hypothetical protein UR54_C0009G0039 [Candidatus Roizmanbacteria bacterium GW2011_GWA2_34_18]|uniref:Uncharacterized protein n=1 Tax=Candidatus Roizmanbacteria bacterium GW2011_GWA2_34_18 TaxID=1618477 RepID=A0A0G0AUP0_9BACT|nr:MAG: hypothetical protein UR54_C0009G0039 [Candidatus Roizmanbacteria bacterium GW2011_GWA2_34_18]
MENKLIKQLIQRLDASLSLQMNPINENATDQEKIKRLNAFGFTPAEIASILDSTSDKISKQLYVIKNKKKEKK